MGKNPLQLATLYAKKDLSIVILPARFEEPSPMNPLPHHPVGAIHSVNKIANFHTCFVCTL